MELQRSETTDCLRADTNGRAADLPAHKAGFLFQNNDNHLPGCFSAILVTSNKHTKPSN
jgi:hypothetical protein